MIHGWQSKEGKWITELSPFPDVGLKLSIQSTIGRTALDVDELKEWCDQISFSSEIQDCFDWSHRISRELQSQKQPCSGSILYLVEFEHPLEDRLFHAGS